MDTDITGLNLKISPKLLFEVNIDSIKAKYGSISMGTKQMKENGV